jgi:hypothetical protein
MVLKYLLQPYPCEENKWRVIVSISLFIGLFMLIFQPFGLSELRLDTKYQILAGYGLVTFIILVLNLLILPYLFPNIFNDEKWTVLKELIFLVWVLFTLGLGNLVYSSWTMGFKLNYSNILFFQGYTVAVGIIPITMLIIGKHNYMKRKNTGNARTITENLRYRREEQPEMKMISIGSDNGKEMVEMPVGELLFVKSEGNYIIVGYLAEGKVKRSLLRNTLKYASDVLFPHPFIFQCHRSWLVNLKKVEKVNGNSQGLRIVMKGVEDEIPVARKTANEFRQRITLEMS